MEGYAFSLAGHGLVALPSGALWWPSHRVVAVSDLHLGQSDRVARRGGLLRPAGAVLATLDRLADVIEATDPAHVICLGDSFDDLSAQEALEDPDFSELKRLAAGREWVWIEGSNDPGPLLVPGSHLAEWSRAGLVFRQIARPGASAEVSGHHHPRVHLGAPPARPCFVLDDRRVILPAFGAWDRGRLVRDALFDTLFGPDALAIAIGTRTTPAPRLGQMA